MSHPLPCYDQLPPDLVQALVDLLAEALVRDINAMKRRKRQRSRRQRPGGSDTEAPVTATTGPERGCPEYSRGARKLWKAISHGTTGTERTERYR
jgi:hypothetical protein